MIRSQRRSRTPMTIKFLKKRNCPNYEATYRIESLVTAAITTVFLVHFGFLITCRKSICKAWTSWTDEDLVRRFLLPPPTKGCRKYTLQIKVMNGHNCNFSVHTLCLRCRQFSGFLSSDKVGRLHLLVSDLSWGVLLSSLTSNKPSSVTAVDNHSFFASVMLDCTSHIPQRQTKNKTRDM